MILKRLSAVLTVLILCFALCACSGGGKAVVEDITNADASPVTRIVMTTEPVPAATTNVTTPAVQETTTAAPEDQGGEEADPLASIGAEAQIFNSGRVFFIGTIFTQDDNEGMPVQLACDGTNVHINVTTSGVAIGLCVLNGETYLISPATNEYIVVSPMVLSALGLDDFDFSSISNLTQSSSGDADDSVVTVSDVSINGEPGRCTEFTSSSSEYITKLYTKGDKLVQCDSISKADGKTELQIVFDSVSGEIPSDMLSLSNCTKASNALSFIKGLFSGI